MSYISVELRRKVVARAGNRCEYCGLSQQGQAATFHVDHIVPLAQDGPTALDNLALACVACSLYKGARQEAVDPQSGEKVSLLNPQKQNWDEHFRWEGERIVGHSKSGRATVEALKMNRPILLAIRAEERMIGRHPPPTLR